MTDVPLTAPGRATPSAAPALRLALAGLVALGLLYVAWTVYMIGQPMFGAMVVLVALGVFLIFGVRQAPAARFVFPGIATMALFVVFPILYTIWLGFTNYGSFNLLTFPRAKEVLLSSRIVDPTRALPFALVADGDRFRIYLDEGGRHLLSEPVTLDGTELSTDMAEVPAAPEALLERREAVQRRAALGAIQVVLPDGTALRNAGLREFAPVRPEFVEGENGTLVNVETGTVLTPDHSIGFYVTPEGERVPPGWRTFVGLENFERIAGSEGIRGPILSIFLWTFAFAAASAFLTFAVGLGLAAVLQWEHLRFKGLYRVLLILPYAVPAFISVLVFRGLFNQNFGEINLILEALFGIRPDWFTDGTLARTMLLIVNTWLGYPYMMLLGLGFLQAVPAEQKKAAYLEGASVLRVFFTITLPQILPPFIPILLACFAFNFNNIMLVLLLTRGGPDIPGTVIPAGETDILGSFTYRMAFLDSGTQFGLAGAITLLIFVTVSVIAYANFVAMRRAAGQP